MPRECDEPVGNDDHLERIEPTLNTEYIGQCYHACGLDRAHPRCPTCGVESTATEDSSPHETKQIN